MYIGCEVRKKKKDTANKIFCVIIIASVFYGGAGITRLMILALSFRPLKMFAFVNMINANGRYFSLRTQGNAEGSRSALWFRCRLQKHLFELGCFLQRHAGKVLFVAILVLATFCVGLKSVIIHSKVDQLWTEGNFFFFFSKFFPYLFINGAPRIDYRIVRKT